ncbi:MAG: ATP-dependent protease subunit HslV [Planctomycetota bacterium]|jgi:ATP-dependent HslUV protease subunit HslV
MSTTPNHSTTVLLVRRGGRVAAAADGQVTLGDQVVKGKASKIRSLQDGKVLVCFAGAAADGLALIERFEKRLSEHAGSVRRAAVELAKDWRTDRSLRRLEAVLLVAGADGMLMVGGSGDVLEPDDDTLAAGSGGGYARAAARALLAETELPAEEVARRALEVAAELCIYTNSEITVELLKG